VLTHAFVLLPRDAVAIAGAWDGTGPTCTVVVVIGTIFGWTTFAVVALRATLIPVDIKAGAVIHALTHRM